MKKTNIRTIGFASYQKRAGVDSGALLEACERWRRAFLEGQPGIVGHRLLGNLEGHFADIILAESRESFDAMAAAHPAHASSQAMLELLDLPSIQLRTNDILGDPLQLPTDFACVEYGTFGPKPGSKIDPSSLISASKRVEDEYLTQHDESRGHAVARVDEQTYSEIAFVRTLSAARRICGGYIGEPACADLLGLFAPESTELDFWYVLA